MPSLRGILILVTLAGAGVFAASVFLAPIDSGTQMPPEASLPPLEIQEFDDSPVVSITSPKPESKPSHREDIGQATPSFSLNIAAMKNRSREPIPGAQVRYRQVGSEDWTTRRAKTNGKIEITMLSGGTWEIQVACPGFFPSEVQTTSIPREDTPLEFHLLKAAHVEGTIAGVDGSRVNFGLVRFTNQETGEVKTMKPSPRGSFLSPPLKGGAWTVDWVEQPNGIADARLAALVAVAPGERRKVEMQIFRTGMTAPSGTAAGTRIVK